MDNSLKREKIAPGAYFSSVSDPRFKFNRITFGFLTPLRKERASLNALVPRALSDNNAEYPKMRDFNNYLASLYNAKCDFEVASIGDTQFLGLSINFMDDSYALHDEKITEQASKTLFDCIFRPVNDGETFLASTVELSKRMQIEAIESELNDKRTYAANQAKRIICEGEPAAVNPLGDVENTHAITPESIYKAHYELLNCAEIEIICVGCNDFSDALRIAKENFAAIKMEDRQPLSSKSECSPLKSATAEKTELLPLLNQSKMVLGFKTGGSVNNREALSLMSNLYGGTVSSKLFLNVRERLSLCYYCWSRVNKEKGVMFVACGVEEANIEKAKAEILTQLDNIKKGDFTDDDFNSSLLFEQNNIKTVNDNLGSLTWWYLTRIYIKAIKSPEEALADYENITREDLINAADSMTLDTVYVLSGEAGEESEDE
ncbi:MAG: insulinase family protein [Oscillospiraceae bacterium]|jgi:predicted Zn-dependent peptidase|nr:insulinase family protein [Oscillospiraceae bacterium]